MTYQAKFKSDRTWTDLSLRIGSHEEAALELSRRRLGDPLPSDPGSTHEVSTCRHDGTSMELRTVFVEAALAWRVKP